MAIQDVYQLHAVKIGATVIGQIVDQNISVAVETFLAHDSGSPYNRLAAVDLEDIRITFTTTAVLAALNACGLTGQAIGGGTGFVAYFKKQTPGGIVAAGASATYTFTDGVVIWRGLSAPGAGGLVTATFEFIAASADGATAPYAYATAQADAVCATQEAWVADAANLALIGFDIDTGIAEGPLRSDGEPWFTHVSLDAIQPVISHRYHTIANLGVGACGSLQITDVASGGYRAANPITFTFNEELTTHRSVGGAPAVLEKVTHPVYDGANAPIVISGIA